MEKCSHPKGFLLIRDMGQGHKSGAVSKSKWIVAGLLVFGLVVVVAVAALLPVWIVRWLGGKDF